MRKVASCIVRLLTSAVYIAQRAVIDAAAHGGRRLRCGAEAARVVAGACWQASGAGLQVGLDTLSGPGPLEDGVVPASQPDVIKIRDDCHRGGDESGGTGREPSVQNDGCRCHVAPPSGWG